MIENGFLESEAFAEMNREFDDSINKLMSKLTSRQEADGDITIKLNVSLMKKNVTDEDTGEVVEVVVPYFDYSISVNVTEKEKKKGLAAKGQYHMRYNSAAERYELIPIDEDGQTTLF